jgi:hypothetical protein
MLSIASIDASDLQLNAIVESQNYLNIALAHQPW